MLKECRIEGTNLYLPKQLGRDLYGAVLKALKPTGAKWVGGKTQAIVFADLADLAHVDAIINGGSQNPAKDYQFFPTPDALGDYLVDLITADLEEGDRVLEPSAGDGALIKAFWRKFPEHSVEAFELWERNQRKLRQLESEEGARVHLVGEDFLAADPADYPKYKLILANPPFAQNQDIRHVRHMLKFLAPGGQLVTIMSRHWHFASDALSESWKSLVKGASKFIICEDIEAGSFTESGTQVATCLIVFYG
ncbi:MAG: methyltransferase [Williamsia sp.]|nr:methyltransferase [Williamsia sp.]